MALGEIDRVTVAEGTDNWNSMRWRQQNGDEVLRSDLLGWSVKVTKRDSGEVVYEKTIVGAPPSDITNEWLFFDTLQANDGFWDETAAQGYNNRHFLKVALVGAGVMLGGASYVILYQLETVTLGTLKKQFIWDIETDAA